jgi:acyl-CoA synthetase (AMP-forming)/AMP-acid ligase II/acyl-CoA reductase-like NAD-dependent aldehyde dehydrogenase
MTSKTESLIDELINRARISQSIINDFSQEQIDELLLAIAWEVIKPENNQPLSEMAVEHTGCGKVEDKMRKNQRKTMGLLRDLRGVKTVGVINKDSERGLVEIAKPVGVIGAIAPSTNPIATPLNKTINALKCRNAIIIAPSPKGAVVCQKVVALMQDALRRVGAPVNLVQALPMPISKENTNELTEKVDLVVATGSQNNIRRALSTGTPTLGVGVGNVPSIVDESANLKDAAAKIKASKTFDNATSCSSENSVVILDSIYNETIAALTEEGGTLLSNAEKCELEQKMWNENGVINRDIIAKPSAQIAELVGLDPNKFSSSEFLLVEETGIGQDYPFSMEKLSPILTVYRAFDFDDAVAITSQLLKNQGQGHSCSIHSRTEANIDRLGLELPVCRIIVNQAHCFATGGNFDNALPFSLSMGCGTWGNNVSGENLNYKQYLNITKIVRTIKPNEPTEEELFGAYWQKHLLPNSKTITNFVDKFASSTPNKTYLIEAETDSRISYSQLKTDILKLGSYFEQSDIKAGDKVGFLLDNSYAATLLFLGSMYHGVIVVPVNIVAGNTQIKYTIDHSGCKKLFVSGSYTEKFDEVLSQVSATTVKYENLDDLGSLVVSNVAPVTTSETPAVLIYTSGTTGVPKGVLLNHGNVLAGGENTAIAHQVNKDDISLCVLPLYHINAEMVSVSSALISNSCVVMMSKFHVSNFWQTIEKYRCTWFSVVPTIINYLVGDNCNVAKLDLSCIRFGRSASAPLSPEVHKSFERMFNVHLVETMGLTETSAQILSNPLGNRKHGSAGIAYGNEVRIVNDLGEFVKPGEIGELVIKGNNVMTSYYNNDEATKSAFNDDGYLLTGDLGREDGEGFFYITGRKKELIIKGGENISPREIDDALYQHNAILEACAFGVSDDSYGEDISAYVLLKDNCHTDEEELKELCTSLLGSFKTPSRILFVDEPLPKGPSGKIQRLKIAESFAQNQTN